VFPGVCGNWSDVRKELGVAGLGLVPDELANREFGFEPSSDDGDEDDDDESFPDGDDKPAAPHMPDYSVCIRAIRRCCEAWFFWDRYPRAREYARLGL